MEVSPLSVILVKSDSKGDRLLFRYPHHAQECNEPSALKRKNPYALPLSEDLLQSPQPSASNSSNRGGLRGISDEVLSSLFAVKPELCNQKFELKVNDVRFVGHPTLLQLGNKSQDESGLLLINIVFALQALASHSVVNCYYDLSQRMGISLRHEENRCGYVSEQILAMVTIHDDSISNTSEIVFKKILDKCTLASNIQQVYYNLCSSGLVDIRINKWIPLSFCLPQKVHQWHIRGKIVEPEDIDRIGIIKYHRVSNFLVQLQVEKLLMHDLCPSPHIVWLISKKCKFVCDSFEKLFFKPRCLKALRPYHSLLLLYPVQKLYSFPSLDGSPSLLRMFSQYSPLKSLQTLAIETDITLSHIFELTAHLVYWAKATVIYPICSTNKYVIAPDAPLQLNLPLADKFADVFPGHNLIKVIGEYSLPTSLGQKCNPLYNPSQQSELIRMIIWMLQHHLLLQLHTYIQYIPTDHGLGLHNLAELNLTQSSVTTKSNSKIRLLAPTLTIPILSKSRTESESDTSLLSGTSEPRPDSELTNGSANTGNISLSSAEEEKPESHDLLLDFPDDERSAIFKVPASNNSEDLNLFASLCRNGHFQGNHHVEEIMYLENLRRSQLLQLLDKFRDVLVTYETEDPAIATFFYSN